MNNAATHERTTPHPISPSAQRVRDESLPHMLEALSGAARTRARRRKAAFGIPVIALLVVLGSLFTQNVPAPGPSPLPKVVTVPAQRVPAQAELSNDLHSELAYVTYLVVDGSGVPRSLPVEISTIERIADSRTGSRVRINRLDDAEFIKLAAELGQSVGLATVENQTVAVGWSPTPRSGDIRQRPATP